MLPISSLPRELRRQLLLYFDYTILAQLSDLLDDRFWMQKAETFGVDGVKFVRRCAKYELGAKQCYLRYLTLKGREYHPGSERFVSINSCAYWAGKRERRDLIDYLVSKESNCLTWALRGAARKLRYALLEELEKKYEHLYTDRKKFVEDIMMFKLAKAGDMQRLPKMLEVHWGMVEECLPWAVESGNIELFESLFSRMTTVSLDGLMLAAACGKSIEMLKHVASKFSDSESVVRSTELLEAALRRKRPHILRYLLEQRSTPLTEDCYRRFSEVNVECLKVLAEFIPEDHRPQFLRMYGIAIHKRDWDSVAYFLSIEADRRTVLTTAVGQGWKKGVKRILALGPVDRSMAIHKAKFGHDARILALLQS